MLWMTFLVVLVFTILSWFIFSDSESLGWRVLLTMSASGLAFWIMMAAIAACGTLGCVGE
jgi:hypothetical protein